MINPGWTSYAMIARHIERIERDGYTVIEDFLDAGTLAEVRRVLDFYVGTHAGRNDFEGIRTERVYTLVARGRVFWSIALDSSVLALCRHFLLPGFLLTASQAIHIEPGETPQPFHSDDAFYLLPRPRPMISLSTIVAVDPFTAANGGTQVIPGSHRWGDERLRGTFDTVGSDHERAERDADLERAAVSVEMPAGACVVFAGTLVHRGGANRSESPRCAFSHQYCQPWARQQENFVLSIPAALASEMPEPLQELLGYSIHPPFIGQLTASHPKQALAPGYTLPVVAQARAVGAKLPE